MTDRVVVIGSGASGVHFALSILHKGYRVLMLDVGHTAPPVARPDLTFAQLKRTLTDPVEYFLGARFESVLYPGTPGEYYGFPPSKRYVFAPVAAHGLGSRATGFEPLASFARGGLAQAWTAGVYPFTDQELDHFHLSYGDLAPYYDLVSKRIGISGAEDDLSRFFPSHKHLLAPLRLDEHSARLLAAYEAAKGSLNRRGCHVGRSRIATASSAIGERQPCTYLGRCLWGCPTEALYTPSITLRECLAHPAFEYAPGWYVTHFGYDAKQRIRSIAARRLSDGAVEELEAGRVVLAAGTLASSGIFLESIRRRTGTALTLSGLMDNRQALVPFVNLRMIRKRYDPDSYQYHQLCLGLEGAGPSDYVHGQITTLKTALIHPIVQNVPLDLRSALFVFRNVHAALGLVNLNFADTRRPDNYLTLETERADGRPRLVIRYSPPEHERSRIDAAIRRLRAALLRLGCLVPPGMTHLRPMGASVHYAGTLPMSSSETPLTASLDCRSHDFENLFFVDGTTFPFLPAKNLTFTLMANAVRVADRAF